jgi:hypothetical protein
VDERAVHTPPPVVVAPIARRRDRSAPLNRIGGAEMGGSTGGTRSGSGRQGRQLQGSRRARARARARALTDGAAAASTPTLRGRQAAEAAHALSLQQCRPHATVPRDQACERELCTHSVREFGHLEYVRALLEAGAPVAQAFHCVDGCGRTCQEGHVDCMRALLETGAPVVRERSDGVIALGGGVPFWP